MAKRKSQAERARETNEKVVLRQVSDGLVFGTFWSVDGFQHGPSQFATMEEAIARRDRIMTEHNKPIPLEYYERQARIVRLEVWVSRFVDGNWLQVEGSIERGVWRVEFVD